MKASGTSKTKNKIIRALELLLILILVFTAIPAMPGEAASAKSKALAAYKKKLSASKVTVLPAGKKVVVHCYDTVTYKYSHRANIKFDIAYIDNDNIPELILQDARYCYGVWTYKNGKVICVHWGDSLTDPYGYYRKKGIYEDIHYTEGSPFYKLFYQFKNGKMARKMTKTVLEEGKSDAEYYVLSKRVSKASFKKKLKSYVGSTHVTKISLKKNTSTNRKKYLK